MKKEIRAWEKRSYPSLEEGRKREASSDKALIDRQAILVPIILFMTAMDGFVLWSVMDRAMMQSAALGIITSIGIALILNFLPIITARFVKNGIYRIQRHAMIFALISVAAFAVIYGATVLLRFSYRDMYGDDLGMALVNTLQSTQNLSETANAGKESRSLATVALLSLEPLATSLVNFLLAFVSDDPMKKKVNYLSERIAELTDQRTELEAEMESLTVATEFLLKSDEEQYRAACNAVSERAHSLRAYGLELLMEKLHDPSAASRLSYEALNRIDQNNPESAITSIEQVKPVRHVLTGHSDYMLDAG